MLCPDSLHQILGLVRLIIQASGDWGLLTKFFSSDLRLLTCFKETRPVIGQLMFSMFNWGIMEYLL